MTSNIPRFSRNLKSKKEEGKKDDKYLENRKPSFTKDNPSIVPNLNRSDSSKIKTVSRPSNVKIPGVINFPSFIDMESFAEQYKKLDSPIELNFPKKLLTQLSHDLKETISPEKQLEDTQLQNSQLCKELEESKQTSKALGEMLSILTEKLDIATKEIAKKDRQLKEINIFLNLSSQKNSPKVREVQSMNNISSFKSSQSEDHESNTDLSSLSKNKKSLIRRSFKKLFKWKSLKENMFKMEVIPDLQISNNSVANISELCELLREKELSVADLQLEIVAQKNQIKELESRLSWIQKDHQSALISKKRLSCSGIFSDEYKLTNMRKNSQIYSEEIMLSFYVITRDKTKKNFIGNLLVNKDINWTNLHQKAKKILKNFINLIDSRSNIGIGLESIQTLIAGKKSWTNDKDTYISLPCSYLSGYHDNIYILLKGVNQKAIDELAFDLLISNKLASRYMEEIIKKKRFIIYGPQISGKYHMACKLAEHARDLINSSGTSMIEIKKIFTSETTTLSASLINFIEKNDCKNIIFLVKNIDKSKNQCLDVQFRKFFSKIRNLQVYIIGTCRTNSKIVKELEMEYKFKINRLALHMEPLDNIISRVIIRESINTNNSMTNLESDREVANFLTSTWRFINDLLESNDKADKVIGPFIFTSCPFSNSKSDWFVRTWNDKIIPMLKQSLDSTPNVEPLED